MNIGTANKIATSAGRLPTGQRQINQDSLKSIGFTTNVKVEERAVTRQGLEGMNLGLMSLSIDLTISDSIKNYKN